ncbi:hypothetical protein U9M48_017895 [Paspalum notatum var. saurae]|uniref:Myb/SANT-like DNA-binding domain-containing protein n=1 Tax=Paspalum notatum var. saurae TaxID=547442 RepID=A0AAQ3T8C7_PASNO
MADGAAAAAPLSPNHSLNHESETLATPVGEDDAAASTSPSPAPSSPSSSGASPRGKHGRTDRYALGFEFAPRLAPYEVPSPRAGPKWTERSTFALLDAWGDRFVRAGRSGIRADEWLEVARLASAAAGHPAGYYSETQCRNRVDTLRKMFKKERERARLAARRSTPSPYKWVYYDKMASIMCPPPPPPPPLPPPLLPPVVKRRRDTQPSPRLRWGAKAPESLLGCGGGDAGGPMVPEPRVVLAERVDLAEPEPQKISAVEGNRDGFVALKESIQKFEDVFVRMESRKKQHMAEVEQMRKDLQRDLDAKWREILEKAQAEIACLSDEDGDEGDAEEDGDGVGDKRMADGVGDEQNNGGICFEIWNKLEISMSIGEFNSRQVPLQVCNKLMVENLERPQPPRMRGQDIQLTYGELLQLATSITYGITGIFSYMKNSNTKKTNHESRQRQVERRKDKGKKRETKSRQFIDA